MITGVLSTSGVAGAAPSPPAPRPTDPAAAFAQLDSGLGVPVGLAITPTGGGPTVRYGDLAVLGAWSTAKVPVAIAAEQRFGAPAVASRVQPSIVNSDNDAQSDLWKRLGGGQQAANAANAVLRADGNPGSDGLFGSDGQSTWSFAAQSRFASRLGCTPQAAHVVSLMRGVAPVQRWGVQSIPGTAVKGGWGPDGDGYDVRQMALVPTPRGTFGLAMGTRAPTFEAGQRVLNRVGAWVRANLATLPAGRC
jgi:hypothetical protein